MRVFHKVSAGFDDPNLVSCAGLVPVLALAERAGLHELVGAHVRVPGSAGSNPGAKVAAFEMPRAINRVNNSRFAVCGAGPGHHEPSQPPNNSAVATIARN